MWKKLGVILIILIILGGAAYIYFNAYFLPVQLKEILSQKGREYLSRPVSFRKISYQPLKGIVLQDLVIYQKDNPREPVLLVEEIYGNVLLPALFKNRQIIVPSITIVRPQLRLIQSGPEQWNFSDLLARPRSVKTAETPPVLLGALIVRNGYIQIDLLDHNGKSKDILENVNLKIKLSLKKAIAFEGTADLRSEHQLTTPVVPGTMQFQGALTLPSPSWSVAIQATNLPVSKYTDLFADHPNLPRGGIYLNRARLRLTKNQTAVQLQGDLDVTGDVTLVSGQQIKGRFQASDIQLQRENRITELSAKIRTGPAAFRIDPIHHYTVQESRIAAKAHYENNALALNGEMVLSGFSAQWPKDKSLRGNLNLTQAKFQHQGNDFSLNGKVQLKDTDLQIGSDLVFQGNATAESFSYNSQGDKRIYEGSVRIENGHLGIQTDKTITGNFNIKKSRITVQGPNWSVQGDIESEPSIINIADKTLQASPILRGEAAYDPQAIPPLSYSGTLILDQAELTGLPRIETASAISGRIDFKTNRLSTHALDLVALGHTVRLSGSLENPENPAVSLTLAVPDASLQDLYPQAPQRFKQTGILPEGTADLTIEYTGPLKSWRAGELKAVAEFKGISVNGLKLPAGLPSQVTDLTGTLTLTQNTAIWDNIKASYAGDHYGTIGRLDNFSHPSIDAEISSSQFDTAIQMKIRDRLITISSLKGEYGQSSWDITGELENQASGTYVDLKGGILLDMNDLPSLIPAKKELIQNLNPRGVLGIKGQVKGRINHLGSLMVTLSTESPSLILSKYQLKDLVLNIEHGYQNLSRLIAKANLYGGALSLTSAFDLKKDAYPFEATAQLQDANLVLMRKDLKLKGEDLAGTLAMNLAASGSLKNFSMMKGYGNITVTDGLIWKLKILEGIWKLLFIPEFEGVAFTDASATFSIQDRKIKTDDLLLKGLAADMSGKGWIDFDKNIEFTISPTFKETEIIRSKSIKKGLSTLLARTEGYIAIDITGPLAKPRYKVNTFPTKIIEKATGALIEGVGDVLQGIFQ